MQCVSQLSSLLVVFGTSDKMMNKTPTTTLQANHIYIAVCKNEESIFFLIVLVLTIYYGTYYYFQEENLTKITKLMVS